MNTGTSACSYPWCSWHQCLSESQVKHEGWPTYHCNTFSWPASREGIPTHRFLAIGLGLGNQDFGCFFPACQRLTPFCLSPLLPWITDNIMLLIILAFSWLLFHLSISWPLQLNLAALTVNHGQISNKDQLNWNQPSTPIGENRSIMVLIADFLTSLSLTFDKLSFKTRFLYFYSSLNTCKERSNDYSRLNNN